MLNKKFLRSRSFIGRYGYSYKHLFTNSFLDPPISNLTPNVVKTTGSNTTQESLIPIASLFSSMDLIQPSMIMKKSPTPYPSLRRAKTSFEQDTEPITM